MPRNVVRTRSIILVRTRGFPDWPVIAVRQAGPREIVLAPGIRNDTCVRTMMSGGFLKEDQATQWNTSRTTDQRGSVAAGISPSTQ
jgi:hypothetical protein